MAKVGSHFACRISSDQSQDSDDNQPPEGPKYSNPPEVHQQTGSSGYEPSSVTGHKPIVKTISTSGAKVHGLKDTHPQVDSGCESKQRSSSSESGHETSIGDSMKKKKKKKKHKRRRSPIRSPAPRAISFSMHQLPDSMVKEYNWMLTDTAGDAAPDQSNPRVIIIDEMPKGDEVSHHDQSLGNPFTSPGEIVAGPFGHRGALPPDHSHGSGDGGVQKEEFCALVQTLEGIVPLSSYCRQLSPLRSPNQWQL